MNNEQLAKLRSLYENNKYIICTQQKKLLAEELSKLGPKVTPQKVANWYQRRRHEEKKKGLHDLNIHKL